MQLRAYDDFFDYPTEGKEFVHHPIGNLSASVYDGVVAILNSTNKWRSLLKLMVTSEIDQLQGRSPFRPGNITGGEYLMRKLKEEANATVTDLFINLDRVKCRRAMVPLREYVDEKYHVLLDISMENFRQFLDKISLHLEYDYRKNYLPTGLSERGAIRPVDTANYNKCMDPDYFVPYQTIKNMTQRFRPSLIIHSGIFSTIYSTEVEDQTVCVEHVQLCQMDFFEFNSHQFHMVLKDIKHMQQLCDHENILELWGYSFHPDDMSIFYTYPLLHNLEQYIYLLDPIDTPLPFDQRFLICRGIASGLAYLHTHADFPLIHTRICPENIYLDEQQLPKIGNFSFAREGPLARDPPMATDELYEISGFFPIEYNAWPYCLSTKVDVYSYGVTLLQLLTCRVMGDTDGRNIRNYVHNLVNRNRSLDHVIDTNDQPHPTARTTCIRIIYIAYLCTKHNYIVRPEMKNVLKRLQDIF